MKILLFGGSGLLGSVLSSFFDQVWAPTEREVDITKLAQLKVAFNKYQPDFIINAAAYTAVDDCQTNYQLAQAVNHQAVVNLSKLAFKHQTCLVHFSTDYVFDGQKGEAYLETDAPNPINKYGLTKLAAEKAVLEAGLENWYLIRLAGLFGQTGHSFLKTMVTKAQKKSPVSVVSDQITSLTYNLDLASAVKSLITANSASGIYHLTNKGYTSWSDLAGYIFSKFGLEKLVTEINSTELKPARAAKRPLNSSLRSTKGPQLRSWQLAVDDCLAYFL